MTTRRLLALATPLVRGLLIALGAGVALTYVTSAILVITSTALEQSERLHNFTAPSPPHQYYWWVFREHTHTVLRWSSQCQGPYNVRVSPLDFRAPRAVPEVPDWLCSTFPSREHEIEELNTAITSVPGGPARGDWVYEYHDEFSGWPMLALRATTLTGYNAVGPVTVRTDWGIQYPAPRTSRHPTRSSPSR